MPGTAEAARAEAAAGHAPSQTTRDRQEGSLLKEMNAAAGAAFGHARKVAETATAEARLTAATAVSLAAAAAAALAFLLLTWICLLALGVWLAIEAGLAVWLALAGAVALNVAGLVLCRWWVARLVPNLGFARTRRLLGSGEEADWRSAT